LDHGAVAGGIGKNKASTKAERGAGGFQGVAACSDVVDEIGLAEGQGFAGAGEVVLVARDRAEGMLTGEHGALMEACVRSACQAGVFKPFQVLADRPLAGCECYDACACDKADGLFKLHYLKAGMGRLNFDYFVWLGADTLFARNPRDVLGPLGRSPIHVPLELNLSALSEDREWRGVSCLRLRELFQPEGLTRPLYLSRSAFWIVHHEAIEPAYDLALGFWHRAKQAGIKEGWTPRWVLQCNSCARTRRRICWRSIPSCGGAMKQTASTPHLTTRDPGSGRPQLAVPRS
jgi:hypothetical protein